MLAPGACLALELGSEPSHIYAFHGGHSLAIPAAKRDIVLALVSGLDASAAELEFLHSAIQRGFVVQATNLRDPVIEKVLAQLGQAWLWQAPRGQQARLFHKLYRHSLRAHAQRKVFVQGFGQTPCLPETSVRRAMLCGQQSQRVLCVGDDDLMAVPLAMLGHQVCVYDVDNVVLLPFLRQLGQDWNLDIQTQFRDLTQPATETSSSLDDDEEYFDWVLTDPMSTRACFELFLSRALEHLRPGGHIACTVHPAALRVFESVRQRLGLEIEAYHSGFNHYYNESYVEDEYRSDMAVLVVTEASQSMILRTEAYVDDLFSGVDAYRQHAWCELRPGLHYYSLSRLRAAMHALINSDLYALGETQWFADDTQTGFIASLLAGGQLIARAPLDGHSFYFAATPYNEARDEAALAIVQEWLPHSSVQYGNGVPRGHRPILASYFT